MIYITTAVDYILSLDSFVLIPLILLILALIIGMSFGQALKSAITVGIGFIGISLVFSFFIEQLSPAVNSLASNLGLAKSTLDVGWTPLALMTWDINFAALALVLILALNILMLVLRQTKTMNIDIFNFWHMMFVGALVQATTGSLFLALSATLFTTVLMLKLADWAGPFFEDFTRLKGVTTTTLSAITYLPIGIIGSWLFDRTPGLRDLNADAEAIKRKFGMFGDPLIIGLMIGLALGFSAGYDLRRVLTLAIQFAAVIFILPRMTDILATGLKPISEAMSLYITKRFTKLGKIYIGVDTALILGEPSVLVTGIFLIPIAIILSLILPGVSFIPLGDLSLMMILIPSIVISNKGNTIRSLILGIPIVIGHLYAATAMAATYTAMAHRAGLDLKGYEGPITSFIDGGNLLRYSIVQVFDGNFFYVGALVLVLILMWLSSKILKANKSQS